MLSFDHVNHEWLLKFLQQRIKDRRVLRLIVRMLKAGVMEDGLTQAGEEGTPQGSIISPLLSNIYLDPLDHQMSEEGFKMVRYADDFVILCRSREEAEAALARVQKWTAAAELTLHPEKTTIVDARTDGFDFLGYHFHGEHRWPRQKSLRKLKETIRAKTRRANGHSLSQIISDLNQTLRGWFEYFKHSHRWTFSKLDSWIRMRLRSILRKRRHGTGRGRGYDHKRWPNRYFADRGLFFLVTAHESAGQSSKR